MVKYVYDAWGNHKVLDADGNEITDSYHIGRINPYRYRGYYFDTNSGLYYLKSRFYDPETGRFLNADTVEYLDPESINGLNLYAYCGNNPIMYSDPSGHSFILAMVIGALIGMAVGFGGTMLADYADDGVIFNGSIGIGGYIENTLVGGIVGALLGGIAGSTFSFTIPTIKALQTTIGTIEFAVEAISIAVSGKAILVGAGVIGVGVMFSRIGKSGGYRIDHHYPNDHDPKHVHISGDDGVTKVDLNGNPIQGNRPMTSGEKKAFWKLIDEIIAALKPWM